MSMAALRLTSTANMSREEWLGVRRKGIGGSEIAAIAGLSPFETPLSVYLRKIGELPDKEETEAMYWGSVLENVIAEEYKRRHPEVRVRRVNAVLQHPEVPYFLANIDREIRMKGAPPMLLEIKTTSAWLRGKWREDIPDHVMCQVQWYMGICGYQTAVVAVLIGGQEYREFEVARDDEIIGYLQEIGRRFWEEHVVPKVPPAAEGPDVEALAKLHPTSNGEEINLPPTALDLIDQYDQAQARVEEAERERDAIKAKLQAMLGDNERGIVGDRIVSWPTVTTSKLDTKRLREEHPEIYEQYVMETTFRRFMVR